VGAVSVVSVLTLAVVKGVLPVVLGISVAAAFALGVAVASLLLSSPRRRTSDLDGTRRYRDAFDHLPLATLVARASDLGLVYASPEAERMLGQATRGSLGDVLFARLHEQDLTRVLVEWRGWLAGPRRTELRSEHRLVGLDGRVITVDAIATLNNSEIVI